jgi:ketopantoate reductase
MPSSTSADDVVLIGLGQMGSVFAHAFLRAGHTVHPVNRDTDAEALAERVPEPALCLVAVGEAALPGVLEALPAPWRSRVGLLQNELLPRDWEAHEIADPTVAVVWFEKKKTIATKVILPTPVAGPAAEVVAGALRTIEVDAGVVERGALVDALVAKNLYILVANVGGLAVGGGTVGELFREHRDLVDALTDDVLALQGALAGRPLDRAEALRVLEAAVSADPEHGAKGRSAPARLKRALAHAEAHGLEVPRLKALAKAHLL